MAKRFASILDFMKIPAKDFVLPQGTSFPASPVVGQKFYRTDLGSEYVCTNATGPVWTGTTGGALSAYPVGAVYMSVVSTSPATLFGGTWSAWGTGRVPVGVDTGQTEFDTVEETGGAKTHTLSVAEMPVHVHGPATAALAVGGASYYFNTPGAGSGGVDRAQAAGNSGSAGSGSAHNNLQPYITCYMWKRTA